MSSQSRDSRCALTTPPSKANRAEIYNFDESGLTLCTSFTVYGIITGLLTLRPSDATTDHLFITTDHHDYFTVSWDSERDTIRNERVAQDVADKFLRDAVSGPRYLADPGGRMLGLQVYEGLFLAIPLVAPNKKQKMRKAPGARAVGPEVVGNMDEHTPIRMKELNIVDITFLYGTVNPVLAILHRDGKPDTAQLATYEIVGTGAACS